MDRRRNLQALLVNILGSSNVYFQPPPTIKMEYPCIVYERSTGDTQFADNNPYTFEFRYKVTYIDRSPENEVVKKLLSLPKCTYDRFYTSDGLNHDVFNLYF